MSQLERANDLEASIKAMIRAELLALQTCCPVDVVTFDPIKMTATCQPNIRVRVPLPDGTYMMVQPRLLVNVPVLFQSGGGFTTTYPIAPGDEGICVFSSRAIDLWWRAGGLQDPIEFRIFSWDDGFLFVGPRSQVNLLTAVSTTQVQMRSDDGTTYIGIGPVGVVDIVLPSSGLLTITGNVLITGTLNGHTP